MAERQKPEEKEKRFVILDRDGTIIEERHYLSDPDGVELLSGAAKGLRQLAELGLGLVVITNQSGVGRGYFDHADVGVIHQRMIDLLEDEGVRLEGIHYCPHTPQDNCQCRKPQPGLLDLAVQELGFNTQDSFVIGDKASDIELGQRVGATTFLVSTGFGAQVAREGSAKPDHAVGDLAEAAQVIQTILTNEIRSCREPNRQQ